MTRASPTCPACSARPRCARAPSTSRRCSCRSGMIPWFPGGHCDPWNHVESAMALDVAGLHARGRARLRVAGRHPAAATAAGTTTTGPTARVEEAKLDTNVCAYVATGVWHHWRCTWDRGFVDHLWPTVERALDWVLSLRRPDGTRAVGGRGRRHAPVGLRPAHRHRRASSTRCACGRALADVVGEPRPIGAAAADAMARHRGRPTPSAFEPKERWAMDWYYPVLTGALTGEAAKARLADGWDDVRHGGQGHPLRQRRAVGHRVGDRRVRARLRRASATSPPRPTCCAGPGPPPRRRLVLDRASCTRRVPVRFPFEEHTSLHRGRGDPRRRRHRRRVAGVGAVHAPPDRLTGQVA